MSVTVGGSITIVPVVVAIRATIERADRDVIGLPRHLAEADGAGTGPQGVRQALQSGLSFAHKPSNELAFAPDRQACPIRPS